MNRTTTDPFQYHEWAYKRVFNHLKTLPLAVYDQQVESVFSSIKEVMLHVYQVDYMWINLISGKSFEQVKEDFLQNLAEIEGQTIEEMERLFETTSGQYRQFLREHQNLDEMISCEHPIFTHIKAPLAELIQQVVTHGTYHRGNISAMLRQMGQQGVSTDYIFYMMEK